MTEQEFGHFAAIGNGFCIDGWGAGPFVITVGDKSWRFEDSDRFGPSLVNRNGDTLRNPWPGPRSPFWRAHHLWRRQGRRVAPDGKTCVWDDVRLRPSKAIRLGGRHVYIVQAGESDDYEDGGVEIMEAKGMDVIFDVDGTLFLPDARRHLVEGEHKDFDEFDARGGEDPPNKIICGLARMLKRDGARIIITTGRRERWRRMTESQFLHHDIPYDALYMRADRDSRPDALVKLEMLAEMRRAGYGPTLAFDDRDSVVAAWRGAGLVCCQVAKGDF
jgi:hypothetical protein